MDKRRQINEHLASIVNELDSNGVRHCIIEYGDAYMIIRSNNNVRSLTKMRISAQGERREEILRVLRESLEQADRDLLARRGRGV